MFVRCIVAVLALMADCRPSALKTLECYVEGQRPDYYVINTTVCFEQPFQGREPCVSEPSEEIEICLPPYWGAFAPPPP